eukprot:6673611-Prymnesium_polylepis.1
MTAACGAQCNSSDPPQPSPPWAPPVVGCFHRFARQCMCGQSAAACVGAAFEMTAACGTQC